MASTCYNFGTAAYRNILHTKLPQADGKKLREKTATYIKAFDKQSWFSVPVVSYLHGELLEGGQTNMVSTVDAFGRENGKQVLASPGGVDKFIAFMQSAKDFHKGQNRNFMEQVREIDAAFMDHERLGPAIIGNQCMDFQKQDGITELEEAIQANSLEMRMNAEMLKDEALGHIAIQRDHPMIVGCVSNFTNFLDLSRKTLRQIEVGVPCVVFSRTNTTQHMFRWFLLLQGLMQEKGMEVVDMSSMAEKEGGRRDVQSVWGKPGPGGAPGRKAPFTVRLVRSGENWMTVGLLVSPDDDPQFLVVDDIREPSLIADWNQQHDEPERLQPGDRIVSVNGSKCSGEDMLEKIQSTGKDAVLFLSIE
mmetsp:Transcript_77245/g.218445  ORF Transcript_77245/g.218445 Transcript_77245/m.218445 type:complete len:363 (+) Transcript_77245:57-1145(+)